MRTSGPTCKRCEFRFTSKRKHFAKGKCRRCYLRDWWRKKPLAHRRRAERNRNIKHRFGITENDYVALLEHQEGACAICRSSTVQRKGSIRFFIDHNHVTGKIRGLLCHQCNRVLGIMKDDPDLLQRAANYLRQEFPDD